MMLSVVPTMEFNDFADSVCNIFNAEKDTSIVSYAIKCISNLLQSTRLFIRYICNTERMYLHLSVTLLYNYKSDS